MKKGEQNSWNMEGSNKENETQKWESRLEGKLARFENGTKM